MNYRTIDYDNHGDYIYKTIEDPEIPMIFSHPLYPDQPGDPEWCPAHDRTLGRISLPFLPFFLADAGCGVGWLTARRKTSISGGYSGFIWFYMVLYGFIWFYMVLFLFYMVLYSFIWPYYGLMWLKQCHKRTIPQITSFIGGIFAIPKWVVYDIVLTKLI